MEPRTPPAEIPEEDEDEDDDPINVSSNERRGTAKAALAVTVLLAASSGHPQDPISGTPRGGTVLTQRFEDYVRAHTREHELLERQVIEAQKVVDHRLSEMNELRQQIERERGTFQSRNESGLTRERTDERLNKLEQAQAANVSRSATISAGIGLFFTAVMVGLRLLPSRRSDGHPAEKKARAAN